MRLIFLTFLTYLCLAGSLRAAVPAGVGLSALDPAKGTETQWALREGKKGAVVIFLSTVCPCSASHEPAIRKLAADFPEFDFIGLVANSKETAGAIHAHFLSTGLGFPVLQDRAGVNAKRLGALKTPHAFVFLPSGEQVYAGGVDDSHRIDSASRHYLREALAAVAKGGRPAVAEARALGCYIE